MRKHVVLIIKIIVMLAVVTGLAYEVNKAWHQVEDRHVAVDWRWGGIAVLGFCGSMLTSATVWRFLAWRMGDRSATVPLLGAYTFSQMGKYIPGKVALLLMRIERSGRFGMKASVCTLSTLLENALYMISGGVAGMVAILRVTGDLRERGEITGNQQVLMWVAVLAVIGVLAGACFPPVFYGAVNRLLKKMQKPQVPAERRLGMGVLAVGVAGFLPCWVCGGVAMWASVKCVHAVELGAVAWFAGAYALSVIIGMASLLPGGLIVREGILGAAVTMQLVAMGVNRPDAVLLAAVAAGLQRLFQIGAEVVLGVSGGAVTSVARGERGEKPKNGPEAA